MSANYLVRRFTPVVILLLLSSATSALAQAAESGPAPFTAVYALKWHGFTAGRSTVTLRQTGPGTYEYRSVNRARGLFRLAFPHAITETSHFEIVDGHVRPLAYREVNGPNPNAPDVDLHFDWNDRQAWGVQHGKPVNQPLQPGTEDPLSVQVELMRDLEAGASPTSFLLFDQDRAKQFHYTREGTARIDTALGSLATVIYRSDRPGSDRILRMWLAPRFGYLPVKAERLRNGSTEFELDILHLKRGAPAASSSR